MITKKDLETFLSLENDQRRNEMKEFYLLPVEERVRKRRCIANAHYDETFKMYDNEYGNIVRFTFEKNISDLKVGDYVLVTRNSPSSYLHVSNMGIPIIDIGNDFVDLSYGSVSIVEFSSQTEYTLDAWFFDSRDIIHGFMNSNDERKGNWLNIINDAPQLEFNEFPNIESQLSEICQILNINLTDAQHRSIIEAVTNNKYSLIQGPPGTGKTFVIAIMAYLMFINGNRVIISSSNHLAINNVLCRIHETFAKRWDLDPLDYKKVPTEDNEQPINTLLRPIFKIGKGYQTEGLTYDYKGEKIHVQNLSFPNVPLFMGQSEDDIKLWIIGLTPQSLYYKAAGIEADVLILDEAGQLNIPTALMAMQKADFVVLVGDHQQLSPIFTYKEHPAELQQSIFQALYRDYNCVTLDNTYRMNEQLCTLISESFYDGKLKSVFKNRYLPQLNEDIPLLSSRAVLFKDIEHNGTCSSEEEADSIVDMVAAYIKDYNVSIDQMAIIAPFRAQCALIRRKLHKVLEQMPVVDTIDRMQGQERDIIFISFTAGDYEYASELVDFLYNPNKINVALSRARCKLIMVGNKSCIFSAIRDSEQQVKFLPVLNLLENKMIQPL